ncbi:unnamed protein product [Coffea canephora]|uniref:RING-type domain-containing protein n=2 Tax=Coffea TaxID=13442 RepID=A0A068UKE1_COFCA|nr:RING-H2 finger protein ATL67-like [Coffea arabica]XP_027115311.1 RING-H2 finger protein ATL67-like [Coffea arabica]CDP08747.1 unnamed protein product [Coffea canephora]
MSTPPPPPLRPLPLSLSPPLAPTTKTSLAEKLGSVGLGYAIAIAFGFLVLLSTVLLASYICCRSAAARRRRRFDSQSGPHNPSNNPNETSIYLPRIIFVTEDENDDEVSSSENAVVGLDQAVINSYPKFHFSKINASFCAGNDPVCSICLCDYKESEMLRLLPDCKHYFHVTCIDAWLKLNASCPVCRNSPLPTPLSTPLSEVVPLSQYSGGRRRS